MQSIPLLPFGSEVSGIDIGSLTADQATHIRDLVARRRVVVFRDQTIGDNGLVAFLKSLGELTFTEGETPVPAAPDLNLVSNLGRAAPPRSVFHTDTSYVPRPPALTALRPVRLPDSGGATEFSDQVAAADRLVTMIRSWLTGRTLLHRSSGLEGEGPATRHPILRRHPLTQEVSLYLSTPERCSAISGLDAGTSDRVIAALYRYSTHPFHLYRHVWRTGDILLWDNRVTMHRADHSAVSGDRVLHRGMVLGEIPVSA